MKFMTQQDGVEKRVQGPFGNGCGSLVFPGG